MSSEMRKCVKCPERATLCCADVKKAAYCKPCFIQMIKHKFGSTIGKRRLYKDGEQRETLVVYDGTNAGAFLLSLVSQGLRADAHKRLTLVPTVMVLFKETDEAIIDNIRKEVELIKKCIAAPWICVHIAAVFESNISDSLTFSDIYGIDHLRQWTQLLTSCSSLSTKEEVEYLCSNMLCIRIARKLGINKVMLSMSADELASTTLSSLALARGPSVFHAVNVVDKRHGDVTLIRPLREISEKEIALLNRFEGSDQYILNVQRNRLKADDDDQSLQSVSRDFISDLIINGFTGTVTTILSIANKIQAPAMNSTRCVLCASVYNAEEEERYCFSCMSVLDQVGDKILLKKLLDSICTVIDKRTKK